MRSTSCYVSKLNGGSMYLVVHWFIPLSKWVITPVISGLTILIPFITGVITHLLSGMNHQVGLPFLSQISSHSNVSELWDVFHVSLRLKWPTKPAGQVIRTHINGLNTEGMTHVMNPMSQIQSIPAQTWVPEIKMAHPLPRMPTGSTILQLSKKWRVKNFEPSFFSLQLFCFNPPIAGYHPPSARSCAPHRPPLGRPGPPAAPWGFCVPSRGSRTERSRGSHGILFDWDRMKSDEDDETNEELLNSKNHDVLIFCCGWT